MAQETIDLFTNEEHAIISDWLDVDPQTSEDELPGSSDALEALSFIDKASAYSEYDAAVAAIVLERIQGRLPNGVPSGTNRMAKPLSFWGAISETG